MKRDPARREAISAVIEDALHMMENLDIAHDASHADRVWRNARIVGQYAERDEQWVLDGDVIKLAAYLHDIAPRTQKASEHAYESAAIAETLLRKQGLAEIVWPVCQIIVEHSYSSGRDASSNESRVLSDADRLDALGAIGIARSIATGGILGAKGIYHPTDPLALTRTLDDRAWVVDNFRTKLLHLAETMNTRYAKVEGKRRTRVLRAYYDALLKEAGFIITGHELSDE